MNLALEEPVSSEPGVAAFADIVHAPQSSASRHRQPSSNAYRIANPNRFGVLEGLNVAGTMESRRRSLLASRPPGAASWSQGSFLMRLSGLISLTQRGGRSMSNRIGVSRGDHNPQRQTFSAACVGAGVQRDRRDRSGR